MKLERRDRGASAPEETPSTGGTGGKKPVIIYIFVLFIVAFLLMIWSLFSHQRSNTEALGELQTSVSAMQEVQGLQEQVIQLQKELAEARNSLDEAREEADAQGRQAEEAQASADLFRRQCDALYYLYALQQQYLLRDFDGCRETIQTMEDGGFVGLLGEGGGAVDVTSPALRYRQLKEAVEAMED